MLGNNVSSNGSVWQPIRRLAKQCSVDAVLPVSATVPSSSKSKKQTHSLQWVLWREDLVIYPTCEMAGVAGSVPRRTNWERACVSSQGVSQGTEIAKTNSTGIVTIF